MKKSILSTLALGLIVTAGAASAAPINQDIHVIATVPTSSFYVIPEGGWPTGSVQLNFDPVTSSWDAYDLNLRVLSTTTSGNVSASLAYAAVLANTTGTGNIPMVVSVAGNALSTTPVQFHTAGPTEMRHVLRISSNTASPSAGDYQGTVSLVFDAATAGP